MCYAGVNENESVKYRMYNNAEDDNICIECYESCIIIVHQNITSLNLMDGLLNISEVYQLFKRADENKMVHKCINDTGYQIAVIPLIEGGKYASTGGNDVGMFFFFCINLITIIILYCMHDQSYNYNVATAIL